MHGLPVLLPGDRAKPTGRPKTTVDRYSTKQQYYTTGVVPVLLHWCSMLYAQVLLLKHAYCIRRQKECTSIRCGGCLGGTYVDTSSSMAQTAECPIDTAKIPITCRRSWPAYRNGRCIRRNEWCIRTLRLTPSRAGELPSCGRYLQLKNKIPKAKSQCTMHNRECSYNYTYNITAGFRVSYRSTHGWMLHTKHCARTNSQPCLEGETCKGVCG